MPVDLHYSFWAYGVERKEKNLGLTSTVRIKDLDKLNFVKLAFGG